MACGEGAEECTKESCVICAQAEGEKNGTDSWRRLGRTRGASGKPQHPGFFCKCQSAGRAGWRPGGDLPGGRENRPLSGSVMQKTDSKTLGGAFLSGRMDCLWQRGSGSDLSAGFQAEKPKKVLLTAPAFAEYEQAAALVGSRIYFYELKEEDQFQIQEDILGQITPDTDLVFLCEPNNPTGQCTKHSLLTAILERCRECSALLVLDECFLEFLPDRKERTLLPYLGQYPNLVILRAFTKLYAMAGVRLGYCVCSDAKRKEQLMESGQPWGVSLLAQEAGVAALSEQAYADRVRKLVEQQRPILVKGLRQAGFTVWEGKANYLLFRSHDATLGKRMEEAGFPMRDCSNYHNLQPGDYRIAVRTEEENRGFLEALFLCQGKGNFEPDCVGTV